MEIFGCRAVQSGVPCHSGCTNQSATTCDRGSDRCLGDVIMLGDDHNKPETAFTCQNCGKIYRYKAGLYAHRKNECGKAPSLQCPHCPHRCKQRSNLKSHIALKHFNMFVPNNNTVLAETSPEGSAVTGHKCPKCGNNYRHRKGMIAHMRKECGRTPYLQCPYYSSRLLPSHPLPARSPSIGSVSGILQDPGSEDDGINPCGEFPCPTCGKIYLRKNSRRTHMLYECGKEPNFKCPFCTHRSKQPGNMRRHVALKHTDLVKNMKLNMKISIASNVERVFSERRGGYTCYKCGKVYGYERNMLCHLRNECGREPSVQCPHCPHRTKQKSNLKKHILRHHPDPEVTHGLHEHFSI
ncbi:hypothetical protein LSTR_LSTR000963 [Laodelphax striatellus]|uniref:C2H2-type domain-containing protein n=1 Tax=Laodelphax striatellus TaxID=195883 RepID=A0A482X1B9_LAOST|nr:hypothetical protein LSTR_LSTR000963 [Laodelphax striatellus]